jgi:small subunit ribosomal protein S1
VEKADEVIQTGDMVSVKLLKIEAREGDTPKISLSIKQVDANPWDSMGSAFKPGDQVMGKVVRLAAFGAFVELAPGVDGLVHISEMSHTKRVLRPEDVVQQGEQVQVVIKAIDQTTKRISLSIKDGMGDPWTGVSTKYIPGSVVTVALEKKETFGLFMNLEPGVTGLMPISNIRNASNSADYDKLKPGDSAQVLVQEVDEDNRRITLASLDQKDTGDWKQFAQVQKKETMGTMASLFQEAMDKKK